VSLEKKNKIFSVCINYALEEANIFKLWMCLKKKGIFVKKGDVVRKKLVFTKIKYLSVIYTSFGPSAQACNTKSDSMHDMNL